MTLKDYSDTAFRKFCTELTEKTAINCNDEDIRRVLKFTFLTGAITVLSYYAYEEEKDARNRSI
jgi:hypothetical protein